MVFPDFFLQTECIKLTSFGKIYTKEGEFYER